MSDIESARAILQSMLDFGFDGADTYRRQLHAASLTRHATGCSIQVDKARTPSAQYEDRFRAARLPVEAAGHGKLLVWVHGFEGYLDDMELLNASSFPDPATVRIRPA